MRDKQANQIHESYQTGRTALKYPSGNYLNLK